MNEFKDQLDAAEKEKVSKLISELRELAVKGQATDPSATAEVIIGEDRCYTAGFTRALPEGTSKFDSNFNMSS
jgi:hypothetical protein